MLTSLRSYWPYLRSSAGIVLYDKHQLRMFMRKSSTPVIVKSPTLYHTLKWLTKNALNNASIKIMICFDVSKIEFIISHTYHDVRRFPCHMIIKIITVLIFHKPTIYIERMPVAWYQATMTNSFKETTPLIVHLIVAWKADDLVNSFKCVCTS